MSARGDDTERMDLVGPPQRRWGDGENVGSRLAVLESVVSEFRSEIQELRLTMVKALSRPSWAVTAFLTFETSAIAVLATILSVKR